MQVSRVKNHNYLVMDLNFSVPGEVTMTMVDYLKKVIADLTEEIMKTSPTPTGEHILEVYPDEESNMLEK